MSVAMNDGPGALPPGATVGDDVSATAARASETPRNGMDALQKMIASLQDAVSKQETDLRGNLQDTVQNAKSDTDDIWLQYREIEDNRNQIRRYLEDQQDRIRSRQEARQAFLDSLDADEAEAMARLGDEVSMAELDTTAGDSRMETQPSMFLESEPSMLLEGGAGAASANGSFHAGWGAWEQALNRSQ
eukprot:TRINITY_DN13745_c0_g1_i1.p1 TRINITY_DN13745_c0_g1~~TRINITY_DN13745_c0_g1_i1.p1  ORF type:complete len:189 (-),score=50.04 TRINITY_DN13745_c0_g1_i1:96-662(-)